LNYRILISAIFYTALFLVLPLSASASTTYIPVGDEIYPLLDRLEAEGVITSGLLNTRPISRAEAERLYREAEGNSAGSTLFVKDLVGSLRRRLGSSTTDPSKIGYGAAAYIRYIRTDTTLQALQYNNDGDKPAKGSNLRVGADLRLENAGPFALDLNPEFLDTGPERENIMHHGYAVVGIARFDMVLGKDAQWWGPGRHGALLLSNNADPFTMVRLTNPEPIVLPWVFKHLGDFRFSFFITQLERDRDFPEPYLWGMRFDFKPGRTFEVGIHRTAILGGEGRPNDSSIWGKSLFPFFDAENTGTIKEPGDQRAGFDLTWSIPAGRQPVQLYLEMDGEDEKNNLPNIWAWIGGVYLPRIGSWERLGFRFEVGSTMGRPLAPSVWYNHSIYTSGYTYNGRIIGHHIGTDTRDLYFELSYHLPERDSRFLIAYDRHEHNMRGPGSSEIDHEAIAGADMALSDHIGLKAFYNHAWVRNFGNQFAPMQEIGSFTCVVSYTF